MVSEPDAGEVIFTLLSYNPLVGISKNQISRKLAMVEKSGGEIILLLIIFSMARWKTKPREKCHPILILFNLILSSIGVTLVKG